MGRIAKSRAVKVFRDPVGFAVLTRVSVQQAEERELLGVYRAEFCNQTGELLGYRLVGEDLRKVDTDLKSIRTRVLPGAAEMLLNLQRSATEGLSEVRRREREVNGKPPEDRVERFHVSLTVLPYVGPERGDILRVWPKR